MTIAVVKKGETLEAIAKRYRVDPTMIIDVNGLETTALVPGLALYIPTRLSGRTYIIKEKDTLSSIAMKFMTSITMIKKSNPGLPNILTIGREIIVPTPFKKQLVTLGFSFPASSGDVFEIIEENGDKLTYLAIVAYSFTEEGFAYVEGEDLPLIEKCKQNGVTPLLMIRNFQNEEFNANLAGDVLANPSFRTNLQTSIMNFVKEKGYGGVSMDLEFVPPTNRLDYLALLRELKEELKDLVLQVNVHAKTEDNLDNKIVGGHDYVGIGKIADLVAIMTIDYGYPTGPPAPISPIWWMRQVLQYAISTIPSSIMQAAIPMYGYDWLTPSNKTTALSAQNAQNLAIERNSDIRYDKKAASPTYSYVQEESEHIVWFEDIRSLTEKYQVIDAYELAGATYWQIGLRFPQNWAYIEQNILVKK